MRKAILAGIVRAAAAVIAGVVVATCIVGAVGFGLLAVHLWLTLHLGASGAAIATAGAAIAVAALTVILLVLGFRLASRPRRVVADGRGSSRSASGIDDVLGDVAQLVRANPRTAVLGAFVAGGLLGFSPALRKDLAETLAAALRAREPPGDHR